jgi:hypothetical protein
MPRNDRDSDLIEEIERYLEAVDLFRGEGCAPRWRADLSSRTPARKRRARSTSRKPRQDR